MSKTVDTSQSTDNEPTVKLLVNRAHASRQLRVTCAVNDGAEAVFDLMDGGRLNVQTSHGHYVAMERDDVKHLIMFAMTHLFPDGSDHP